MSGFGSRKRQRDGLTRWVLRATAIGAVALLQACSATSPAPPTADSSRAPGPGGGGRGQQTWQQPSTFDADGPPSGGVYRGGRDPLTGKAQTWSPGGPVETSSIPPEPAPPPAWGGSAPSAVQAPVSAPTGTGLGLQGLAIVRPGDTLQSIAAAHGVPVATIMQANHLKSRNIKVGQRLVIPQ